VIHGYFHQRPQRAGESVKEQFTTRLYTAGEGEFFDLPVQAARDLVSRARDEFRSIGLDPTGFIAPAWLLGSEAESAIRELGLSYTTRLGSVLDLASGDSYASQSLVWSVRAAGGGR
jgi:predicted deacetylase